MQRLGHSVEVLTYGFKDESDFTLRERAMIKRYKYQGIPVISIKHQKVPEDISFVFNIFDAEIGPLLRSIISKNKYDIIHIAHPMRLGYAFKAAKLAHLPIVVTLTDFWLMCPRGIAVTTNGELCTTPLNGMRCIEKCYGRSWRDRILQRFNDSARFINEADAIISPSNFLASLVEDVFNIDVDVIGHGVDYADIKMNKRLKFRGDEVVIGYIGTILPHKGIHIAIEAMKLAADSNIKLKIYGNYFNENEYYENLIKITGGDTRIEFLGEYEENELRDIMCDIDCLLAPSIWWENSPFTIRTSLAFKVPVITTDIGGCAEFIKNRINGFNFKIGNSRELAGILKLLSNNPELLNKLKDNIVTPPRIEEEAFEYELLYLNLINR
jgi:glycosyltransferase involved in cell wall biosynthesis